MKCALWHAYKVDVRVVDRGLLQADVEEDEHRVSQVAGEADVGERNPETQWQEALYKAWRNREKHRRIYSIQQLVIIWALNVPALGLPPWPSSQASMIQVTARAQSGLCSPW